MVGQKGTQIHPHWLCGMDGEYTFMPFLPTIENCLHLRQPWIRQFHEIGPLIQITRRALVLCNNVSLRIRRALLPKTLYSDSSLLVLNGTSLNGINLMPFWLSTNDIQLKGLIKQKREEC